MFHALHSLCNLLRKIINIKEEYRNSECWGKGWQSNIKTVKTLDEGLMEEASG